MKMGKTDWIKYFLACFALISVCTLLIGAGMYCEWLKTVKLYNAGLITRHSVEYSRIVDYEPSIYLMGAGGILAIADCAVFAITRAIKNGKKA